MNALKASHPTPFVWIELSIEPVHVVNELELALASSACDRYEANENQNRGEAPQPARNLQRLLALPVTFRLVAYEAPSEWALATSNPPIHWGRL